MSRATTRGSSYQKLRDFVGVVFVVFVVVDILFDTGFF
jgi:hypothetical protein